MHGANIQDRDGAKGVLKRSRSRFPFVELAYVDGGYAGRLVRWAKDRTHIVLEVVKRSAEQVGFAVIQRRWVVERTLPGSSRTDASGATTSNSRQWPKLSSPSLPPQPSSGNGPDLERASQTRSQRSTARS